MEEEEEGAMQFDEEAPLAQSFKRKRKATQKKKEPKARSNEPPEAAHDPESAELPPAVEHISTDASPEIVVSEFQSSKRKATGKKQKKEPKARPNEPPEAAPDPESAELPAAVEHHSTDASPETVVSEFDYSVENHMKAVDTITKLCGLLTTPDANQAEIKRFSNSITFLREWRDFNYAPRLVKFACQRNSKEKDVIGGVTLPQFSAASVPKTAMQNGSESGVESSKDFVMHVGGAVWALDWCPRVDSKSENHIKSEFVAVAAHPPESSYHKIGAPLIGRGVIQIWCLLTVYVKEDATSIGNKKSRPNSQKKGTAKSNKLTEPPRPRGRPRKKPINDSLEKIGTDTQHAKPIAVEYSMGSPRSHSSDRTSGNGSKNVHGEDSARTQKDPNQMEHANASLMTVPKCIGNKAKAGRDQVHGNGLHSLRQCEQGESALVNPLASASFDLDSMSPDKNITCISSCDASTSNNCIPADVALPRMMLCLAHNGKVAWDVKWRPVNACDPESMNIMGYLAVLLGNGALEVWEVPLPHTVKLVYPAFQELIDPRFIKLQPVFRCSMLKCGDRKSIPLTVEWSVSSPHDMILAGCHDGVVALWKFSVNDSLTETRPLLSFSADTGPIRTLAWAPTQSDLESVNVIVTAGHKGFKFWDIRDPFRPVWDLPVQGVTYGLAWLPDPRCVFGTVDDGTLWLLNLEKAAHDIPVTGKCLTLTSKQGFHNFDCSPFSIWSVQASRLTGMVAYCGEDGTTLCFQPTIRSVRDPSRNRLHHYLCGSLLEEKPALVVVSPVANSLFPRRSPSMKRSVAGKELDKRVKEQMDKSLTCNEQTSGTNIKKQVQNSKQSSKSKLKVEQETPLCQSEDARELHVEELSKEERGDEIEVFPSKIVAMHRVRWNVNKGSEKWLCYGGAAGLLRCQEIDFSIFQ